MSKKKVKTYSGRVWVGFDLGGTKMLAKVFNDDYQTLGKSKQKTQGAKGSTPTKDENVPGFVAAEI